MNPRIVAAIFRKEILDTFRDRRALIAMIGIPLVLYPALFLALSQVAIIQTSTVEKGWSRAAVIGDDSRVVRSWVELIPKVEVIGAEEPRAMLAKGDLDVVVVVEANAARELEQGNSVEIAVEFDATETASQRAATRVIEGLAKEKSRLLEQRLRAASLQPEFVSPLNILKKNTASPAKVTGSLLGMVIPVIMVLMVGVGAFYPAVDLTAGEKERGTFETLLATPAAKLDIVTGKFLTVFCLSMLTAILNLGSMMTTFAFQLAQLPAELESVLVLRLHPQTALLMCLFLAPLAFFVSAAMMSIAVFARSFREAQNYITPFFLVILFPAAVAGIPGMNLNRATEFLPITNVALLFKELMKGSAPVESVFAVLTSTGAYAVLALVAAVWIFQREEVMLADSHGAGTALRRAYLPRRSVPTLGMALLMYCVCLLLLFYLGTFFQSRRPVLGLLTTQWVLILAPTLLICWYAKLDLLRTFHVRLPRVSELGGTLLVAVGWAILLLQAGAWQNRVFPAPAEIEEEIRWILDQIQVFGGNTGLFLIVTLSPAICEESLFRGAILSAMKNRLPAWVVLLLVGFLFGVLHLNVYRLVGATLSGIVLTYLVWRSGALPTAMIAHLIINSSALWLHVGDLPPFVQEHIVTPLESGKNLPLWLLSAAFLVFAMGVCLMEYASKRWSREHVVAGVETR